MNTRARDAPVDRCLSSLAVNDLTTVQQCGLSQSNELPVAESPTCLEADIVEAQFVTSVLSPYAFTALGAWMLSRNPGEDENCGLLVALVWWPGGSCSLHRRCGIVVQLNSRLVATALAHRKRRDRHRAPHGHCVDQLRRERLALVILMEMDGNCWRRATCWGRSLCSDPKTTLRDRSGCGSSRAPSALARPREETSRATAASSA